MPKLTGRLEVTIPVVGDSLPRRTVQRGLPCPGPVISADGLGLGATLTDSSRNEQVIHKFGVLPRPGGHCHQPSDIVQPDRLAQSERSAGGAQTELLIVEAEDISVLTSADIDARRDTAALLDQNRYAVQKASRFTRTPLLIEAPSDLSDCSSACA